MKKTFLQRLVIAFSGIGLLVYGTIYACGYYEETSWDDLTNFAPEAYVDQKYAPYFLSESLFYDYTAMEEPSSRFNDDILEDWTGYLKGKIAKDDISFFFADTAKVEVANLYDYYFNHKKTNTLAKWSNKIAIKDKKTIAFIEFLHYAKPIEKASLNENYWDYEEVDKKRFSDLDWIKSVEKKYNTTTDVFLKNRYWFQVMKAYFYSIKAADAIPFFEKTSVLQPKNVLYYRAVSYLAGIHHRLGNHAQANYLYSQVFEHCDKLRQVAVLCFNSEEEKNWDASFKLAKNDQEKIALWAIRGYYNEEEKAIENIFAINPKSEYLEFLLTRLVNQQEMKVNKINASQSISEYDEVSQDTMSKTATALIDKMTQSGKIAKPYLWNSAAGYLQTLDGNFKKADIYFSQAQKQLPNSPLAINQLRLLRLVNNLSKIDEMNTENSKTVLADLNWLYFELPVNKVEKLRYINATNWSKNYISALYQKQKNPIMAELFVNNNSFFHNDDDIESLKKLINKTNKTPIELIAVKVYDVKPEDIILYQAVVATYENKIPKAINLMKQVSTLQTFWGNPFNGNIKDCHDCDFAAYQKRKYSQLDFLLTIQSMQEKIAKNEEVYTNAMLLGNAFYNITHYGNGRIFYQSEIIGYGGEPYDYDENCRNLITSCAMAKMYYQKAFDLATNNEQKAKMQYMLAKCQRNEYYNDKYKTVEDTWNNSNDGKDFKAWLGFQTLKEDYSKTKFYKEAIAECGYFKTYVTWEK